MQFRSGPGLRDSLEAALRKRLNELVPSIHTYPEVIAAHKAFNDAIDAHNEFGAQVREVRQASMAVGRSVDAEMRLLAPEGAKNRLAALRAAAVAAREYLPLVTDEAYKRRNAECDACQDPDVVRLREQIDAVGNGRHMQDIQLENLQRQMDELKRQRQTAAV